MTLKLSGLPEEQTQTTRVNPVNGDSFQMIKETFASLSNSPDDPLSCVSLANSSLSIDLWKGCGWQCSYCHVQGSERNLDEAGFMPKKPEMYARHSITDILDALEKSDLFKRDESVLSIGTASTEPFAPGAVLESTFDIVDHMISRGWKNPVWIVTKAGVSERALERLSKVVGDVSSFVISPSYGGLDRSIEPVQNNRLLNMGRAAEMGAKIVLYLRPMVAEWGTTKDKIEQYLKTAAQEMGNVGPSSIVMGGIRWTEGIEYGLANRGQVWPDSLNKNDNEKDLPDSLMTFARQMAQKYFPTTPVVLHSSCSFAHIFQHSDTVGTYFEKQQDCDSSLCASGQRDACKKSLADLVQSDVLESVNSALEAADIPMTVRGFENGKIISSPELGGQSYTFKIRALGVIAEVVKRSYGK